MMTIRQIKSVCDKGYVYDIDNDRFISVEEDNYLYSKEKLIRTLDRAKEFINKHQKEILKGVAEYHKKMAEQLIRERVE